MTRPADDIIDEIHAFRQRHAARFGYDTDKIIDELIAAQAKHSTQGWQVVAAPRPPTPGQNQTLRRTRLAGR